MDGWSFGEDGTTCVYECDPNDNQQANEAGNACECIDGWSFDDNGTTCVEFNTKLGFVGHAVNIDRFSEYPINDQDECKAKALSSGGSGPKNAYSFREAIYSNPNLKPCRTFDLKADSNLENANMSFPIAITGCADDVDKPIDNNCQLSCDINDHKQENDNNDACECVDGWYLDVTTNDCVDTLICGANQSPNATGDACVCDVGWYIDYAGTTCEELDGIEIPIIDIHGGDNAGRYVKILKSDYLANQNVIDASVGNEVKIIDFVQDNSLPMIVTSVKYDYFDTPIPEIWFTYYMRDQPGYVAPNFFNLSDTKIVFPYN